MILARKIGEEGEKAISNFRFEISEDERRDGKRQAFKKFEDAET